MKAARHFTLMRLMMTLFLRPVTLQNSEDYYGACEEHFLRLLTYMTMFVQENYSIFPFNLFCVITSKITILQYYWASYIARLKI